MGEGQGEAEGEGTPSSRGHLQSHGRRSRDVPPLRFLRTHVLGIASPISQTGKQRPTGLKESHAIRHGGRAGGKNHPVPTPDPQKLREALSRWFKLLTKRRRTLTLRAGDLPASRRGPRDGSLVSRGAGSVAWAHPWPPPQRHPEPSFCRTVFQRKIKCLLSTYEAPDSIATKIYNTPNDTAYDLFKSFFKFFLNQTKSSKAKPLVKSSIATRRRGQGTSLTCHVGFVCENSNAPATHAGKFLTELLTRKHKTRVIRTWASHIDKETRLIFLKTVLYK